MRYIIVGNPENRRVISFCEAAKKCGAGMPSIISYEDWLSGGPGPLLNAGTIVKIDSPGENDDVRKMLIARGAEIEILDRYEHGEIRYMREWYAGYCHWLKEFHQYSQSQPGVLLMNDPADIALQFNKPLCQLHLQQQNITVPFRLPAFLHYDDLLCKMRIAGISKVFIKPAHASSASGIIAFRKSGDRVQAITTTEMVDDTAGTRLFNSLKIRTYNNEKEIAALINRLLRENMFAEEWIPKATLQDRFFDIRILTIAGKARQAVIRSSNNIITNLHLGNQRGNWQAFIDYAGEEKWRSVQDMAEKTAACFPGSLYMGIDVLISAGWKKIFVLEVNAFGDLLPGLLHNGENCYEAQIKAMNKKKLQARYDQTTC